MTSTRPADPARLSPIPYLTVSLSRPSVIYGLLGALLGLTVAGLLLWFDRLLPTDWSEIRFLHDTLELLAAALMAAAGAELWENGRRLPLVWRSAAEITRVAAPSPVKILAAGLGQGLLLIWAVRLAPLGDWYITGPLALGLAAVALSKLAETRRRWRQLRQLRQAARPDAHALPPRQPARRSLRFTTNSSLNLLIQPADNRGDAGRPGRQPPRRRTAGKAVAAGAAADDDWGQRPGPGLALAALALRCPAGQLSPRPAPLVPLAGGTKLAGGRILRPLSGHGRRLSPALAGRPGRRCRCATANPGLLAAPQRPRRPRPGGKTEPGQWAAAALPLARAAGGNPGPCAPAVILPA